MGVLSENKKKITNEVFSAINNFSVFCLFLDLPKNCINIIVDKMINNNNNNNVQTWLLMKYIK